MSIEIDHQVTYGQPFEFAYDPESSRRFNIEYKGQTRQAIELINEKDLSNVIDYISYQVSLKDFDKIVVLYEGGWFLALELSNRQEVALGSHNTVVISTTRPPGGGEATIANPEDLVKISNERVLVIDDLVDSAGTLHDIYRYLPNSMGVAIAQKELEESDTHYNRQQSVLGRTIVGAKIPNLWVGGSGLDFGTVAERLYKYSKGFPRWVNKMVIMVESLDEDNTKY